MRRTILYISLALLTFTVGFLTHGTFDELNVALPVALVFLVLIKSLIGPRFTLHRVKVAVLTLLIWTPFAAVTLYTFMPERMTCEVYLPEEEVLSGSDSTPPPITYNFVSEARAMTVDRGCIDMQIYESSDGIKVYTSTEVYESSVAAREELKRAVRGNVKVIEREALFDELGRQVGERAVATRVLKGEAFSFIYRAEGNRLRYISSPSLARALGLESNCRFIRNCGF